MIGVLSGLPVRGWCEMNDYFAQMLIRERHGDYQREVDGDADAQELRRAQQASAAHGHPSLTRASARPESRRLDRSLAHLRPRHLVRHA